MNNLVIFDTETTGVNPREARIVELAAIYCESGQTVASFEMRANPGIPIPEGASNIHGITDDMVKDEPLAVDVVSSFFTWLEALPPYYMTAYNFPYDEGIIRGEMDRSDIQLAHQPIAVFDVLKMARNILGWRATPNHRLGTVYTHLTGNDPDGAHAALADVEMTRDVLAALLVIAARGKHDQGDIVTLFLNTTSKLARKEFPDAQ